MRLTLKPVLRPGIAVLAAFLLATPVLALEKDGMPDLCQDEETCVPTSSANLIVWFAKHGYPKLLQSGTTEDERDVHTMHALMGSTGARYEFGTRVDLITVGLQKYIKDAGYNADVEYRGVDLSAVKIPAAVKALMGWKDDILQTAPPKPFTADWLQENDDPNKGFILLLSYCHLDMANNVYTNAGPGHAVTLVNVMPGLILVHDPAHYSSEAGRKILTPALLTNGVLRMPGVDAPLAGHMMLTGSNLLSLPDTVVVVSGAVCITMHPDKAPGGGATPVLGTQMIAGKDGKTDFTAPSKSAPPATASQGWAMWFFKLIFGK